MRESKTTDAPRETRVWASALATAAALVITGCESTVAGTSVEPTDQKNPDGVTVALLDPGSYPTTAVPLSLTPSVNTGVILEGQRMAAAAVVVPSEVDAALRELVVFNTGAVESAQALRADVGLSRANIAAKPASSPGSPPHGVPKASPCRIHRWSTW